MPPVDSKGKKPFAFGSIFHWSVAIRYSPGQVDMEKQACGIEFFQKLKAKNVLINN